MQPSVSRYLGTAAMFSAQTWTRSPRDTLDRVERAAPHSDHERSQIEGRLKFDFLTGNRMLCSASHAMLGDA